MKDGPRQPGPGIADTSQNAGFCLPSTDSRSGQATILDIPALGRVLPTLVSGSKRHLLAPHRM